MRFSLVDVAITTACMALGLWGAMRTIKLGGGMGSIRELRQAHPTIGMGLFLLLMVALGIAAFLVLGSLVYRFLYLVPLQLPTCPHCGRLPDGYWIEEVEWPRSRFECGRCGRATAIWWRRPDPARLDRSLPNLLLCWPESLGRWRLIPGDLPALDAWSRRSVQERSSNQSDDAMMARCTDLARDAIRRAFKPDLDATEATLLGILAANPRGLAGRFLRSTDLGPSERPPAPVVRIDRARLVEQADAEARRRGDSHIGTEHLLLALARDHASMLYPLGLDPTRFDALIATARAEWDQAHPPLTRRLGGACRRAWHFVRRRTG